MTRRRYMATAALPPSLATRQPERPAFARRCPGGEYEVWKDGVVVASGFDDYAEAEGWINDNGGGQG